MSVFEKLAPFIQNYIYYQGWESLKEIQVAACDVIFNSDSNLLIATPTASGKTEAAFLPIITELYNKPPDSVGLLYIAPLKALINDQFIRIEELLQEAHIPVTKWHADASQSKKQKLLKDSIGGVLQITPESLEAMLMTRKQNIVTLFSDLRFIVIDEVHNFLGQDRGIQLSCIMERIQTLTGNIPRRVGLSATIGNLSVAEDWLCAGTNKKCITPKVGAERRRARIMLDHFYTLPEAQGTNKEIEKTEKTKKIEESWLAYYESIYNLVKGKKSIVFANSRKEVERNIVNLKELAEKKRERDVFFVHHGSISASNREYAEEQMKNADLPIVTGATVTLELGIDLGDLDRIVQTGCPHSVSGLAQRLGRSGRRSGISEMSFVFNEEIPTENNDWYKNINWQLVKCIALIELYRENWLEPTNIEKYPFSMLFHQTMSFLFSNGEASPGFLAQTILNLSVFHHISQEDYKELLRFMLENGHIERTATGGLLIGHRGEQLTNHYSFFAVFETPIEYSVRDKSHKIGTLSDPMPPDTTFVLAGKTWTVTELDMAHKVIYVKSAKGKPPTVWHGSGFDFEHTKVLQKMKSIIASNTTYPYLTNSAKMRLEEIRTIIRQMGILDTKFFSLAPNTYGFFPWLGTKGQNALCFALTAILAESSIENDRWPMIIAKNVTHKKLLNALELLSTKTITINDLAIPEELPIMGKFGEYIPQNLLRKQFIDKYIDITEIQHFSKQLPI
ncbi:MAG: DEAD/DEAH box helicase [Defluviitaleaceae bacterium]|nr:DEAD/DEAH box helicase [Defluviitaleaceae bacterium]